MEEVTVQCTFLIHTDIAVRFFAMQAAAHSRASLIA